MNKKIQNNDIRSSLSLVTHSVNSFPQNLHPLALAERVSFKS